MSHELKKDKGCRLCEKIFDCQGKDPRVKLCLQFKERKREEDKKEEKRWELKQS